MIIVWLLLLGGPAPAVAAEYPRRAELAQLVPHHVFRHEHLMERLAVVHHEGVPDELRHDGAGPPPGLDGVAVPRLVHPLDPLLAGGPLLHLLL